MVKQLKALNLIIIYYFIFIYIIIFIYYNKSDNVSTPRGRLSMWHTSLRPDQTFQYNVICKWNAEVHHHVDHR
jgi:hypothetical protein